jgi:hypothetical protein
VSIHQLQNTNIVVEYCFKLYTILYIFLYTLVTMPVRDMIMIKTLM